MHFIGIDPGNEQSAIVGYGPEGVTCHGIHKNGTPLKEAIREVFDASPSTHRVFGVEMVASYGMAVGKTVFETCVWIGRTVEHIRQTYRVAPHVVYRADVKMHLCRSMRAKDANIRQALIDMHAPTGGGKTPQIGTKGQPGPLYGFRADEWAALGVAITLRDKREDLGVFGD